MSNILEIYEKQRLLVQSLKPVYLANGFAGHALEFPWPLDDRHYQEEFRLLAWRFTEELFEAVNEWKSSQPFVNVQQKFIEELADAFHFLIELCLAVGYTPQGRAMQLERMDEHSLWLDLDPSSSVAGLTNRVQHSMANAMMALRQRPWRTDYRPAHLNDLYGNLSMTFVNFYALCRFCGISSESLYNAYMNKNAINHDRRREAMEGIKS